MATCPQCSADMQTDGINSWCVQADCPSNRNDLFNDPVAEDEEDADDTFLNFVCGMLANGQCTMAGTEDCDWECPRNRG